MSEEEDYVVLAKANLEEMTIADLIEAMQGMENEQDAKNYKTRLTSVQIKDNPYQQYSLNSPA